MIQITAVIPDHMFLPSKWNILVANDITKVITLPVDSIQRKSVIQFSMTMCAIG